MSNLNFINLLIPATANLNLKEGLQAIPFFNEIEDKLDLKESDKPSIVPSEVYIFCDGSKIQIDDNAPCAALAFVVCDIHGTIIHKHCAYTKKHYNYEAQSILKALHWCVDHKIKKASIYSDSATDIWHLKNYGTPKYQHKINVYEEVIKNPQEFSRPKRWRGSDQVNILVEKSRIVEKALRLTTNCEAVSFGYIPRHYNSYANDMAKNLTKDYLNRVGVFVEQLPNVIVLDNFDIKQLDFQKMNFVSYRSHNAVYLSVQGQVANLSAHFMEKNTPLFKNIKNHNYDICSLIKDYHLILNEVLIRGIRNIQIFDGKLSALLNGHINIGALLKVPEKSKCYSDFLMTVSKFDKIYVSHNFSNYDKHHKKTLAI